MFTAAKMLKDLCKNCKEMGMDPNLKLQATAENMVMVR